VSRGTNKTPWIFAIDRPAIHGFCDRCASVLDFQLPRPVKDVAVMTKGFSMIHRSCTEREGGEYCAHCHNQGHPHQKCPTLEARPLTRNA